MASVIMDMTQQSLLDLFEYRDGNLVNRTTRSNRSLAGAVAGCINSQGYIAVRVSGRLYRAHRMVWIMHNGPIEDGMLIDHIDGDRKNNKIENLRLVTDQENMYNRKNVDGYTYSKKIKRYVAEIWNSGKRHYLGCFKTEAEARNAYVSAKEKMHIIGGKPCLA